MLTNPSSDNEHTTSSAKHEDKIESDLRFGCSTLTHPGDMLQPLRTGRSNPHAGDDEVVEEAQSFLRGEREGVDVVLLVRRPVTRLDTRYVMMPFSKDEVSRKCCDLRRFRSSLHCLCRSD